MKSAAFIFEILMKSDTIQYWVLADIRPISTALNESHVFHTFQENKLHLIEMITSSMATIAKTDPGFK